MPSALGSWLYRAVLGGLLLMAYLYAWTPARTSWIQHGAAPLVKAGHEMTLLDGTVTPHPSSQTLRVQLSDTSAVTYPAPAGITFLLPALALLLIAPQQPWIGLFFLGHLILNATTLTLLTGVMGEAIVLLGTDFVHTYVVDIYSLGTPVLALARH